MAKYKLAGGFAMTPEREMKLLKDMSSKGWHLAEMKGLGFIYSFEKGDPCNYDYTVNFEDAINQDMLSYYKESGWFLVVMAPGIQVFRANAGTAPIFTDKESEEEVLERNQKFSGKWASIFGVFLIVWFIITDLLDFGLATVLVMMALIACFVFTFFPFLGFSRSLKKLRNKN